MKTAGFAPGEYLTRISLDGVDNFVGSQKMSMVNCGEWKVDFRVGTVASKNKFNDQYVVWLTQLTYLGDSRFFPVLSRPFLTLLDSGYFDELYAQGGGQSDPPYFF